MINSGFSTNICKSMLDGHMWSPFVRSIIAHHRWGDNRVGAVNYIHWCMARPHISGHWTIVYDASHQSYVEDELSKKTFLTTIWRQGQKRHQICKAQEKFQNCCKVFAPLTVTENRYSCNAVDFFEYTPTKVQYKTAVTLLPYLTKFG